MSDQQSNRPSFETMDRVDRDAIMSMLKKGASRRQVLGWLMVAGVALASASAIVTEAEKALAATPKRGGKLKIAESQGGPDDTLDPALFVSDHDYFRGRMFYGSLTRLTSNLKADPELAEEFLPNKDATAWTFKLRKGVEFHDGKTMTADDVIYSMNRHIGANSISKASSLVADVDRWEKVNDHEIRAVMKSPNADLPVLIGTFHFKILQDGATDFSKPVGTGPFRLVEFKPGIRAIGKRFENYWVDGHPYLDEIEFFTISDPVSRLNAFMAGDIDAMAAVPAQAIEKVENTQGKKLWSVKSGSEIDILFRLDMPPSNNMNLIMAMKYLMDRDRIVKGVLKGHGSLGNDQPINESYADYCPDIPQRTLDLDKAKFYFQKSGIGNTAIPIVAAELTTGVIDQCLILQREAAKIGLNIEVKKVPTDGYWSSVWMKEPICTANWNMRPTANSRLTLGYKSSSKWNETFWKNPQFDDLVTKSLAVTDPTVRKQMYCDMQTIIHEQGGTIIPAHRNYVDAVGSYVEGLTYVPLGDFGGEEAPEFLWRSDI